MDQRLAFLQQRTSALGVEAGEAVAGSRVAGPLGPILGEGGSQDEGVVYRVKGDAIAMSHRHAEDLNIEKSPSLKASYVITLLTEEQAGGIRHWATLEAPPTKRRYMKTAKAGAFE